MKLWIVYLIIAVTSMVLFRWILHGTPAGIAALSFVVFALLCTLRLLMGKNIKKVDAWK
jgi:uncharacterized membrane protein YtjA (UPF0391 family)